MTPPNTHDVATAALASDASTRPVLTMQSMKVFAANAPKPKGAGSVLIPPITLSGSAPLGVGRDAGTLSDSRVVVIAVLMATPFRVGLCLRRGRGGVG